MKNPQEKRRHFRATIGWPVTIRTSQKLMSGKTLNISGDGVHICLQQLSPVEMTSGDPAASLNHSTTNGQFYMLIEVPDRYPLKVTAKVIWSADRCSDEDHSNLRVGVQFVDISEGDRKFLNHLVKIRMRA